MQKPKRLTHCCLCGEPEGDATFVKGTLCCTTCYARHHSEARKIEASKAYIKKQQAAKATRRAKAQKAVKHARYQIAG